MGNNSGSLAYLVLWGLIATVTMTSILEGSRGLGFSRLSLPFLVGTFFTGRRQRGMVLGFAVYTIGGWLFAFLYFLLFASVGIYTWWFGALAGFLHGLFLLVAALPLLPSSPHGLGVSRRHLDPSARAARIPGHELRLWDARRDAAGADRLWRHARRVFAAAQRDEPMMRSQ